MKCRFRERRGKKENGEKEKQVGDSDEDDAEVAQHNG